MHPESEFTLQGLSILETLMRMTCIYSESEFVLQYLNDQNHWQEVCSSMWVSLQCLPVRVWATDETGHASRRWVHSQFFEQIRTTNKNVQHCIQDVSCSLVLTTSEPLMRRAEHTSQFVSCSQVFEQFRTTDKNGWNFRKWVALKYLSRSEPLTGMAEHTSSK